MIHSFYSLLLIASVYIQKIYSVFIFNKLQKKIAHLNDVFAKLPIAPNGEQFC